MSIHFESDYASVDDNNRLDVKLPLSASPSGASTASTKIYYDHKSHKDLVIETEYGSMRFKDKSMEEAYKLDLCERQKVVTRVQLLGITLFSAVFGSSLGGNFDFVTVQYGAYAAVTCFALLLVYTMAPSYAGNCRLVAGLMGIFGSVWAVQFCVLMLENSDLNNSDKDVRRDEKQTGILVMLAVSWPLLSWLAVIPNIQFDVAVLLATSVLISQVVVAIIYIDEFTWVFTLLVAMFAIGYLHLHSGMYVIWNDRRAYVLLSRLQEENINVQVNTGPNSLIAWLTHHTEGILRQRTVEGSNNAFWSVRLQDVRFEEKIGEGGFGDVYKGTWRGSPVAIKTLRKTLSGNLLDDFVREVCIMIEIRHPNVLLVMGACVEEHNMFIVTEFMDRGSLFQVIHNPKIDIPPARQIELSLQIAHGISYLHHSRPPIIHRDIKSLNILCNSKWQAKVCDFGLTQFKGHSANDTQGNFGGSVFWTAPELLSPSVTGTNATSDNEFSEASDVFAFAVVIWEILTRQEPYIRLKVNQVARKVVLENLRPDIPQNMPLDIANLLRACWSANPHDRPNVDKMIEILSNQLNSLMYGYSNRGIVSSTSQHGPLHAVPPHPQQQQQQQQQQQNNQNNQNNHNINSINLNNKSINNGGGAQAASLELKNSTSFIN